MSKRQKSDGDQRPKGSRSRTDSALILVVEDEYAILETLVDALGMEGYRVVSAPDGKQALARLDEQQPDLIVMDVMMPVMDGMAVLDRLAERDDWRDIPVILMSAGLRSREVESRPGVAAFLPKPFELDVFLDLIAQILKCRPSG